ncbi:hypothetical protein KSP40_PGU019655 [Platanthera guangdongensis]|uniref:Gamma-glutamylcyclotransferase n=1 Tax=Platanthera guangdongensis TaxID=2320717 RepID=A0ABR2MVS6_9ASPA
MQYLERRECEYDKKASVDFYVEGSLQPVLTSVLVFISTPDKVANRYYLGPAPIKEMARQIATATGPCGNNREYLFSLEKAMLAIAINQAEINAGHEDEYVIKLADEVRKVLSSRPKDWWAAISHVALKERFPKRLPLLETTLVNSS